MQQEFKDYILELTRASACEEVEVIQTLWSGYGKISRYRLEDASHDSVVVKNISLHKLQSHPRGWNTRFSHNRKVKSYKVETNWYKNWSQRCSEYSRIPAFIGAYADGGDQWIVLEDLNKDFPLRKQQVEMEEVHVCLTWLAYFHGTFLAKRPKGLWEIGTYWHLNTRPEEWEKIEHGELKSKASIIDQHLNQCQYQTIVHGDAKLANFCFSEDGKQVAAVDFQYVGGGCGIKDVAYFLGSCLTSKECTLHQDDLLKYYFDKLQNALEASIGEVDFTALKEEWTEMYPIAIADFTRFLLGWMPTHQKVNKYHMDITEAVLKEL